MQKLFAQLLSICLQLLPRRLARAIFYRIPTHWFCFDATISYRGSNISVWTGENIGRKIYFLNDFEGEQIDIFSNLVSPNTVFFDVGANIGVYSLVAGRHGAKCYAFEPSPEVLPYIKQNISLNSYNITLIPEVVGAEKGESSFFVSTKENMGVGRIMEYGKRTDNAKPAIQVSTDTLDHYAEILAFPSLIKMDIEGAEYFALKGGTKMLQRTDAPLLMVEFHPGEIQHLGGDMEEMFKQLKSFGYRQYQHFSAKKERWYVFSKQAFSMEGFSEIVG